jgi:hypothetical protein
VADFLIVSHARAGNVLLASILNQHPRLFCAGEIYNTNAEHEHARYARSVLGRPDPLRAEDLPEFLERCRQKEKRESVGATLFSQPTHRLTTDEVLRYVQSDMKVILLYRQNLLKAFYSWRQALHSNVWHLDQTGAPIKWEGAGPPNVAAGELDYLDVAEARTWIEQTEGFLRRVNARLAARPAGGLRISYEELCGEHGSSLREVVSRMFAYLGVEEVPYEVKTLRTTAPTVYQKVKNREQLSAELGYPL